MKIFAHLPLYPPSSRVGAWLSTHECLTGMVDRGHEVTVATALCRDVYDLDGVQVIGQAERVRPLICASDLVVSHLGDSGTAHRLAVRRDVPSVRMVHGADLPAHLLQGSALAVFNSQWMADRWDGPKVVVHPPVDLDQHRTTPGDRVTLVNLSPDKGVETFNLLTQALPDVQFLAVRGGYGRQTRCRPSSNVELIPTTTDMRADVWSRTRVLLMPSKSETWGRVGLEAMASGIPVIAHPAEGLVESLGDAGIFVDRTDLTGWVREVTRLQDPDEYAVASAAASARAAMFDHRVEVARFCDAVEALVRVTV